MVLEKLFELATPHLKKNDFGIAHTRRVFEIAREHDSDRLVMLSPEEFPHYDAKTDFDWKIIINSIYTEHAKDWARKLLQERKTIPSHEI